MTGGGTEGGGPAAPRCTSCGGTVWPPAPLCAACLGPAGPGEARSRARVVEFSRDASGYFAVLEIAAGFRIMARSQSRPAEGGWATITRCGTRDGRPCYEFEPDLRGGP